MNTCYAKYDKVTAPEKLRLIHLTINDREHSFILGRDFHNHHTLAYILRERLGLTSVKVECDEGGCGACTVLMDSEPVLSCMLLGVAAEGHSIVTVEGLAADDPIVQCFAEQHEPGYGSAIQCGICTPGFVLSAKAFLQRFPDPTAEEIKVHLAGNLCRCGCYAGIIQAVIKAARRIRTQRR